jgi:hypothetical protein
VVVVDLVLEQQRLVEMLLVQLVVLPQVVVELLGPVVLEMVIL